MALSTKRPIDQADGMKKQTNFIMDTVFLPKSSAMQSGYIIDSVSVFASVGISCGLPRNRSFETWQQVTCTC
jgi:hypothetical protein